MASNVSEVFIMNDAHELDGEAALRGEGGRDLAGVQTAGEQHVELLELLAVEEGADRG